MGELLDTTQIEHLAIAVGVQLLLAMIPVVSIWHAGTIAVAVLLGREIAQHEYHTAVDRGWEFGQTMPVHWYDGLLRHWSLDSTLDVAVPAIGCVLVATIVMCWCPR